MISRLVRSALLLTLLWGALAAPGVKADEADVVWRATGGPVAFVTHIAADPTTPDFLFVFVSLGVYRNPDRTQAAVACCQALLMRIRLHSAAPGADKTHGTAGAALQTISREILDAAQHDRSFENLGQA